MVATSSDKRHKFKHAAVATDHSECSRIGRNILHHGGSAVDSAIASLLCLGVVHPHSTGIGGGGFMLVYHRYTRFSEMIDFRENAPLLASKDMFHGELTKAIVGKFNVIFVKYTVGYCGIVSLHVCALHRSLIFAQSSCLIIISPQTRRECFQVFSCN